MPDLARWYAHLRGSPAFLLILMGFVGAWLALHYLLGVDKDFGALNLCLSTEASVSLAFFTMTGERQSSESAAAMAALAKALEEQRATSRLILALAEAERDALKS